MFLYREKRVMKGGCYYGNQLHVTASILWFSLTTSEGARYSDPAEVSKLVVPLVICGFILLLLLGLLCYFQCRKHKQHLHPAHVCNPVTKCWKKYNGAYSECTTPKIVKSDKKSNKPHPQLAVCDKHGSSSSSQTNNCSGNVDKNSSHSLGLIPEQTGKQQLQTLPLSGSTVQREGGSNAAVDQETCLTTTYINHCCKTLEECNTKQESTSDAEQCINHI